MASKTQKALFLTEKFGKLVVAPQEVYKPGPGELLIKVQSASLNPVDWKIQKYGIFIEEYPAILGTDFAGDVHEVGEGVTDFKVGDRVFGQGHFTNPGATFQQYCVVSAAATAKIPPTSTYDEVSGLPVALTAAYVGLYNRNPYGLGNAAPVASDTRNIYGGTPLVVLGGSSSVGQLAIQLAKISSFSPIITTASLKHADFLKSLGATHVIDRSTPGSQIVVEVRQVTQKSITQVYDSISSQETQQLGMDILAPGGQLALVLPRVDGLKADDSKVTIGIVGVLSLPHNTRMLEVLYHDLISDWLASGEIKPNRVEVLPNGLEGIPEGLGRMERDEISREKLVARPQETP